MATHNSSAAGGPLLRVADMLQDLAEDDSTSERVVEVASSLLSSSSSLSEKPKLALVKQDLPAAFEETYGELSLALTQSGHAWTGLTQELCATLTTADRLVATSQLNLGQLSQDVKKLEKVVERGHVAVTRLQTAIGQVNSNGFVSSDC